MLSEGYTFFLLILLGSTVGNLKRKDLLHRRQRYKRRKQRVGDFKSKKQICGDLQMVERSKLKGTKTIFCVFKN